MVSVFAFVTKSIFPNYVLQSPKIPLVGFSILLSARYLTYLRMYIFFHVLSLYNEGFLSLKLVPKFIGYKTSNKKKLLLNFQYHCYDGFRNTFNHTSRIPNSWFIGSHGKRDVM